MTLKKFLITLLLIAVIILLAAIANAIALQNENFFFAEEVYFQRIY